MTNTLAVVLLLALVSFIALAIFRFGLIDGALLSLGIYLLMPFSLARKGEK